MKKVVLMYHNIGVDSNDLYTVPPDVFREHVKLFSEYKKSIILTFDDGYKGVYENALKFISNERLTSIVFVVAGKIGQRLGNDFLMNENQLKQLSLEGVLIGSHGVSHKDIISRELLEFEATRSKEILEDILAKPIRFFSAPNGILPNVTEDFFRYIGYEKVFTSDVGCWDCKSFFVPRIVVRRTDSLLFLRKILEMNTLCLGFRALERFCFLSLKRLIGVNNYEKLKNKLFSLK